MDPDTKKVSHIILPTPSGLKVIFEKVRFEVLNASYNFRTVCFPFSTYDCYPCLPPSGCHGLTLLYLQLCTTANNKLRVGIQHFIPEAGNLNIPPPLQTVTCKQSAWKISCAVATEMNRAMQ